jgi:hypothetical protein
MVAMIDEKTGRKLLTPPEAAALYDCSEGNLRTLRIHGRLNAVVHSPHRIYYFEDEVKRLAKETAAVRKARGGRKRKNEG